jgi:uncharacterized RDD family membrane protein YckC
MQTIKITTAQNIEIDYEVAGLGERIVARIIDFAVFIFILIAGGVIASYTGTALEKVKILGHVFVGLYFIWLICLVFYDLLSEIFLNGQSVGKRIMKIKVISLDGARPSLGQYVIRWLFRIVDFLVTFNLAALVSVIFTKNKQRIGDIAAGTTLVSTKARTDVSQVAFTPVSSDYVPVFNEVNQLADHDIVLIHEVIQTHNPVLIHNMASQIKTHLKITSRFNDLYFLDTIVKDYNFLMAKMDL